MGDSLLSYTPISADSRNENWGTGLTVGDTLGDRNSAVALLTISGPS
jgi:hypothetical protein